MQSGDRRRVVEFVTRSTPVEPVVVTLAMMTRSTTVEVWSFAVALLHTRSWGHAA